MFSLSILLPLAGFAFISSITPGPNNLMLLASGTNFGWTRTIPHMLGISIGFGVMIMGVGMGLMQVFEAYPLAYRIMQGISIAYLMYLAWKIANMKPLSEDAADKAAKGKPMTFIQAAAFQWVNPKAWGMALAAISTYAPAESGIAGIALVAIVFSIVNLPSVSTWTLIGTRISRLFQNPKRLRVFNIVAALTLVGSVIPVLFT
jgi:threonine/homoserine/homoserine lactone efflux protein